MKNQIFLKLLLRLSTIFRKKRIARLLGHFQFDDQSRILDVGGSGDWDWGALGVKASVTTINLYPPSEIGMPNYIQGDARNMQMFKDQEFDLVFSNSVIEHLLSREDQRQMASEISRVGHAYWVQTPNRHFPLELHLCFPFIQYFPVAWRVAFSRVWPFSFQKMRGGSAEADAQAILLTKKELLQLFPGSELICERFAGLTKSLIVKKDNHA